MDDWFTLNQQMWDERVPLHLASRFYDIDGFKSGRPHVRKFEIDELGPLDGLRLLHLQCHLRLDTLSIARIHSTVSVSGLDFSAPAIDAATRLAVDLGLAARARFVVGDTYRAADALDGERFDVVYTGEGALNWLADIDRWAGVVHDLLAPGGFLYLSEFHPIADMLGDDEPIPVHDYFATGPLRFEEPGSYAAPGEVTTYNVTVEWQHSIGRVLTALLASGLRLEMFHEWDSTLFDRCSCLVRGDDGGRRWPGPGTLPLMYYLKAVRPAL